VGKKLITQANHMDPKPGNIATPASLFDFQVNGFAGVDYQRHELTAAQLRASIDALRARGVAAIFLTLITDTIDRLAAQFTRIERYRAADPVLAQTFIGYHLEGPWLNPEPGYRGAHPAAPMGAPSLADFARLQVAAGGNIRLVTLAPEWPGSAAFIAELTGQGVHTSIGHSNADAADIDAAIQSGTRFCTHLGNGVALMQPRHDNIIQRLLSRDDLIGCFIPDGMHLPPFVLKNFVRAKPAGKILFTTDCMAAAGAPPGRYTLGALEVNVGADNIAREPDGGFAGSTLAPDRGVELTARYLNLAPDVARELWSAKATAAFGIKLPA
jgi:N-acetylglucosamine-6-phosphate deacetylase